MTRSCRNLCGISVVVVRPHLAKIPFRLGTEGPAKEFCTPGKGPMETVKYA